MSVRCQQKEGGIVMAENAAYECRRANGCSAAEGRGAAGRRGGRRGMREGGGREREIEK